jgi:hypothetical protein
MKEKGATTRRIPHLMDDQEQPPGKNQENQDVHILATHQRITAQWILQSSCDVPTPKGPTRIGKEPYK